MADRDPDTIKQEIDVAREQLAATVDSLAERANPRRLADDVKAKVIEFLNKPIVTVSLRSSSGYSKRTTSPALASASDRYPASASTLADEPLRKTFTS